MTVLGIDFDVRGVHCVLLDDDSNQATYRCAPIKDKHGSFDAARNVRAAMRDAVMRPTEPWGTLVHGWDDIYLVGIEDSMYRNAQTIRALARVQGAILASIPRRVCVLPIPAGEWKQECGLAANASKEDVRAWALGVNGDETCSGCGKHCGNIDPGCPTCLTSLDRLDWPQDAFDALAIAVAARGLNAKGITA